MTGASAAAETNYYYYSGQGNDLANYMYMDLDLQNYDTATLSFSTYYDIEKTGDFALAFLSPDLTNLSTPEKINGTQSNWTIKSYNISTYAGGQWYFGFYYETDDSGIVGEGFYVDNIEITADGEIIFYDDGESGYSNWTLVRFTRISDQDTIPPVINNPPDIQIEQDAIGSINWVVTETNPDKYWVLRNSTEVVVSPTNYVNNKGLIVSINTSALGIWNYTIFANDTSGNETWDQVNITVTTKQIVDDSSSGGSSGGGGGGASGEDFNNILVSETEREYVNKDSKVSYSFDLEGNIIRYINFTGLTSSGRIAAKVDILKNTSILVDHVPPDKVFKNMGIYVGNLGWANPNNIANPTISFMVDRSWVTENKIDKSTITLNRYNNGKWNPLETDLIDEDQDFMYFESKIPGFSQFAVTGTEASAAQGSVEEVVSKPTIVVERKEPITEQTPDEKNTGIPGFGILPALSIMLVVVELLRRKQ